ncbi:hypothetical protein HRI_005245100 [Hibiscus trionum]|nr:hypothetical protein HRI_005245100 [Hibiscus trionum]
MLSSNTSTASDDAPDVRLTKPQLETLHKLLGTSNAHGSLATQGNSTLFHTYTPCHDQSQIRIADGSYSLVDGVGKVQLTDNFSLDKVLHVLNLSCNLLSKIGEDDWHC